MKKTLYSVVFALPGLSVASTLEAQLPASATVQGLSIQKGVLADVRCSDRLKVEFEGSDSELAQLEYKLVGNTLHIDANQNHKGLSFFSPGLIQAHITLPSKLTQVKAQMGGFITVDECAVTQDSLDLDLLMGAQAHISAHVKTLDANVAQGSFLNQGKFMQRHSAKGIEAENVHLNCSAGCFIKIDQAQTISGSASAGAKVYVPHHADTSRLHSFYGAEVIRQ